jgi:hypothetical protein
MSSHVAPFHVEGWDSKDDELIGQMSPQSARSQSSPRSQSSRLPLAGADMLPRSFQKHQRRGSRDSIESMPDSVHSADLSSDDGITHRSALAAQSRAAVVDRLKSQRHIMRGNSQNLNDELMMSSEGVGSQILSPDFSGTLRSEASFSDSHSPLSIAQLFPNTNNIWGVKEHTCLGKTLRYTGLFTRSALWMVFSNVLATFYSLFADDVRVIFYKPEADPVFVAITTVVFFTFALDFFLQALTDADYLHIPSRHSFNLSCKRDPGYIMNGLRLLKIGSFYTYLDLIATLSMLPEVGFD